jgi:glyoxylase-like metal-dependent hydrolase (beta-lactamase superfamily II)
MSENSLFKVGKSQTRVIGTPGHTLESSCFIVGDENGK